MNLSELVSRVVSNTQYLVQVIMYIILSCGYNSFILFVIKAYGTTHRVIIDAFSSIIIMILSSQKGINFMIQCIGELFILIGVLLYNEIILIRLCDLDEYTEKQIRGRAFDKNQVSLSIYQYVEKVEITPIINE